VSNMVPPGISIALANSGVHSTDLGVLRAHWPVAKLLNHTDTLPIPGGTIFDTFERPWDRLAVTHSV
jgi:hypothetical protein